MHADIYKTSESCDVCDYSDELHALTQVVYRSDIFIEFKHLKRLSWIASRLLKFIDDVVDSFDAEVFLDEFFTSSKSTGS